MFGSAYPFPQTAGHDRPKYGTVNLTDDPLGVVTCRQYGASYFVLNNSVRWRTTMTNVDSDAADAATPAANGMVYKFIDSYSDADFKKIWRHTGEMLPEYPEIQVHGPVKLNRDIDRLVADSNLSNDVKAKVDRFARQNNFKVIWRNLELRNSMLG